MPKIPAVPFWVRCAVVALIGYLLFYYGRTVERQACKLNLTTGALASTASALGVSESRRGQEPKPARRHPMNSSRPSWPWPSSAMLLSLLVSACASNSPPLCSEPVNVAPRAIPPLSKAARQSPPSEPYLERAKQNSERWQQQLQSTSQPASSAQPSTTR